jgi:hypothetical protein
MPSLETPPNSAPPTQPIKVRTGRYGELEEHELIHLLDSLDDERSKARFRESIYISIIIYLGIAWFLFYGPRVLFHQPRLISPVDVLKERDKQLTFLDSHQSLRQFPRRTTRSRSTKRHCSSYRPCAKRKLLRPHQSSLPPHKLRPPRPPRSRRLQRRSQPNKP